MTMARDQLIALAGADKAAIDAFMRERRFPIVEGRDVTFVFRGTANAVRLRHFVYGLPTEMPFQQIGGTDLWYCTLDVPLRSRLEYKLEVIKGERNKWIQDPLNPLLAHDPFGANSVCQGAGYYAPDWTEPDSDARSGSLETLSFEQTPFGDNRNVTLYLPPRLRQNRRYPLLIVQDGSDYLRYSQLKTVLDNLIHRREVAPLVVALSDPRDRLTEYADDQRHADFIVNSLVRRLERELPLYKTPQQRCLMGASFGAVASLAAAWRNPGIFGGLILQSGSFAFSDIGNGTRGAVFDPVVRFMNAFRDNPGRPADKLFVSCGVYESLIYENRSMVPLFQATGMEVQFVEARDGHNWENWRDRLRDALSWMFPGPLWMMYE
ncbi:MAG: hypothetical protein AUK47_22320 [Deltaproteobacteria bacterium CG2_30_63_29]|nr:MAG: hypothetical protein AUK47_22320 [Deltaproteobacteria bacterium CG2_30_63_29]PJB34223.1 MAG: enterochelin esterase [Deltaproteobacteria bacterium CG_4_9_14_3_um_filter_63_12]